MGGCHSRREGIGSHHFREQERELSREIIGWLHSTNSLLVTYDKFQVRSVSMVVYLQLCLVAQKKVLLLVSLV